MITKNVTIRKRDGRLKEYSRERIEKALESAFNEVLGDKAEVCFGMNKDIVIQLVEDKMSVLEEDIIDIELIQDWTVLALKETGWSNIAEAFDKYRRERARVRNGASSLYKSVLGLVELTNEEAGRENSNKDSSILSTQRDLIAGELSKELAMNSLLPEEISEAHRQGILHYHDMDYAVQKGMFNCCLINIEDMLNNGTVINDKLVESPKSFGTACTIMTQIMANVASSQFGGQSVTIRHLAPFLRKTKDKAYNHYLNEMNFTDLVAEDLAKDTMIKELRDGIQTIRYQLNTLQTSNGQSPFATIYLEILEGDEFESEQAMICEEMIVQRLEGMKNYKGQEIGEAFPKLIYVLDDHNCLEGGKYDYITKLCAKCNVRRLVPDYQSAKIMRQNYEGNNFPAMGCRSHLSPWKDCNGDYKFYGRFNQGVVSINLPQIGIIAQGNIGEFWKEFDNRLELCKRALMVRHKLLLGAISDVSPIHWQHGAIARLEKGEKIDKLLTDGYSTISLGYVGIYELTYAMLGVSNTTKEGEKFALEVMNHMRLKCDEWKKETGLGFGLYGSPAENLVYRFCRMDKARFGEIENVTDKLYYTNSYHVNVKEEINAFDKLSYESQFHKISSGGCISYIEVPDMSKNLEAVESVINFIYHNIQYAEINCKPDICFKCGFKGELKNNDSFKWFCPNCGNEDESEMQVMRRTCGYIGTNLFNKGRTQEIKERVTHL